MTEHSIAFLDPAAPDPDQTSLLYMQRDTDGHSIIMCDTDAIAQCDRLRKVIDGERR